MDNSTIGDKMNIAVVSLQYGRTVTGGGGVHVEEIVDRLSRMGNGVTVLSIHTERTTGELGDRNGVEVVRFLVEEGIPHPYVGSKEQELDRIRKFCDSVAHWFEDHGREFDVVHMHGHHMVVGYLAKLIKGLVPKTVSTVHAVESLYEMEKLATGHSEAGQAHIDRLRALESEYRYADVIVAPSPAVRDQISGLMREFAVPPEEFERKIRIITSGIDEAMLLTAGAIAEKLREKPLTSGKIDAVILSRIDPSKGIQFAIRALSSIAPRIKPTIELSIVGRVSVDAYLEELREEAARSDIDVDLHIDVSEKEKMELLDNARIYILPTLQDTFGITLVEAGARGNVIVTTDTDGPMYVMSGPEKMMERPWGYIAPYGVCASKRGDAKEHLSDNLAAALLWVLEHWGESVEAAGAFREKIEREYMWDAVVRAYVELYQR